MNELTEEKLLIREVDRDVKTCQQELLREATWLADRLNKLVERLQKEGTEAHVNELGEVQGAGLNIDRACAKLHAARRAVKVAVRMARAIDDDRTPAPPAAEAPARRSLRKGGFDGAYVAVAKKGE